MGRGAGTVARSTGAKRQHENQPTRLPTGRLKLDSSGKLFPGVLITSRSLHFPLCQEFLGHSIHKPCFLGLCHCRSLKPTSETRDKDSLNGSLKSGLKGLTEQVRTESKSAFALLQQSRCSWDCLQVTGLQLALWVSKYMGQQPLFKENLVFKHSPYSHSSACCSPKLCPHFGEERFVHVTCAHWRGGSGQCSPGKAVLFLNTVHRNAGQATYADGDWQPNPARSF